MSSKKQLNPFSTKNRIPPSPYLVFTAGLPVKLPVISITFEFVDKKDSFELA
jgi:hypothetical protein